jgi:branched-chain amino acid transport system permease protein
MNKIQIVVILVLLVALLAFPQFITSESVLNLAVYVLLYVSIASSWNILGGFCGQTNLGHAAFFGSGALVTRMLWFAGWNIFVSMFVGGLVAVVLALIIGVPAFRLRGVYFAIGTLALSQILLITVGNTFSTISSIPIEDLKVYSLVPRYYMFLGVALLTMVVAYALLNSRFGLGIMAVREEEDAAESLGVSALKYKMLAFGLSAFFGGLTGGAFAFYHVGYYPQLTFGPEWTFDSMMMAYIGGVGTIVGPVIGAIFFVILREFLALKFAEFHLIIFGVLFILVVLFLPDGFMGIWDKIRKRLTRGSKDKQAESAVKPQV